MKRRPHAGLAEAAGKGIGGNAVLLDTSALVALWARDDAHHARTTEWIAGFDGELHTVEAVLAETAHFLPMRDRAAFAATVAQGTLRLHHPSAQGYARIATLFRKYADQDPDWADLALVWLAETTGISRIATFDITDFSVYRIHGRKRFELELLR